MANQPVFRSIDGALPQNIEAEQSVLGSLLIDARAVERVASFLKPDDFFLPVNAEIYRAMLRLFERDRPTDIITLSDHLNAENRLDDMGGAAYLASLATIVPTSINVEYYARIVERLGVLRRLVDAGSRISSIGYDERLEADEALESAEKVLFEISHSRLTRDFEPISKILGEVYEKLDHIHSHDSEITGVTTGYVDLDRLTSGMQRSDLLILAGRPSMGKCLTARTLVDDPDSGRRMTIEECVRLRLPRVLGLSNEGSVRPTEVSNWIDSGVQQCFRVTTRTGRSVEVTGHHPFLSVRGWVPLHDLKVRDKIAVPRSVPVFGTDESWPPDLVRLLAYFLAEGGLTDSCPEFTNTDPEIVGDFTGIVERQFPGCAIRRDGITYIVSRPDPRVWTRGPNPVTRWLRGLGAWGVLSSDKRFPACVWSWPASYLAEFIRTLFSCDATIYGMQGYPRIEFSVASAHLAEDVHHALVRLGIVGKLWRKGPRCWRVEITEPESVERYQAEIGWLGEKANRFGPMPAGRRSNIGHAPCGAWEVVRAAATSASMTLRELGREAGESFPPSGGYYAHTSRGISRRRLAAYAHVLSSPELARLASTDVYWDEITSVEAIGAEQVYDLTVPDGENFIAQDICVHNTALALNIAHAVAVKAKLPVGIFSIEMSAEQLAQRLISIQAQIESQRLRNGRMSETDWDRLVQAVGVLSEAPIFVDDTPGLSTLEMRTKARRLHSEQGLGLIVVDYLQLMQGASSTENRVQEISAISRGLKALARELDVPIMALSQLSRAPDQRPNHEPMLSDLRESGCLTADSRILRADTGEETTLGDLLASGARHIPVWSLNNNWKLVPAVMTHVFPSGVKEVFRLRLASGRAVTASANHPFRTVAGWRPLGELMPGSRLAVPRTVPEPSELRHWDEHEVVLLAHLIGDGCVVRGQPVHYTSADPENIQAVEKAARHFGIEPRLVRQENWWHLYLPSPYRLARGRRNPVAAWLDGFGLYGCHSWEKFVPSELFSLPQDQLALFIRHLWATDGCLNVRPGGRGRDVISIYYATTSRRLADDVRLLLLRFGIQARTTAIRQSQYRPSHHVVISGVRDQLRFLHLIGVHGSRGRCAEEAVAVLKTRISNPNVDTVPWEVRETIVAAMDRVGMTHRQLATAIGEPYAGSYMLGSASRPRASCRERIGTIAQAVQDPGLHALAESDVAWDTVVAIEPLGEQPVYDATVLGTHNFIANNIIVHNSIEQDADIVMFIYRDFKYNPETERPHVADVILAKHRNGPTGTVHLFYQDALMKFLDLSVRDDA